jgi:hypothetical protein
VLAWAAPTFAAVKGIIHKPSAKPTIKPETRDALLAAIAKAREWIDDIRLGRVTGFAEIAEREAQCERHIRLLAPLAFVSPRTIAAIADETAPADLTVTGLAKRLPYSWDGQEQRIGLSQYSGSQTGLGLISNQSALPQNGNWKTASRDWRGIAAPGRIFRKLPSRDARGRA